MDSAGIRTAFIAMALHYILAVGFEVQMLASEGDCAELGPFGANLLNLGHKVCQDDIDANIDLLEMLMRAPILAKTQAAFQVGFAELNGSLGGRLSMAGLGMEWAKWEATKLATLWRFTIKTAKRPGVSRSISVMRLKNAIEEVGGHCAISVDEEGDAEDFTLPACPLTPDFDVETIVIADDESEVGPRSESGGAQDPAWLAAGLAAATAEAEAGIVDDQGHKAARRVKRKRLRQKTPLTKRPAANTKKQAQKTTASTAIAKEPAAASEPAAPTSADKVPAELVYQFEVPDEEPGMRACKIMTKTERGYSFLQLLDKKTIIAQLTMRQFPKNAHKHAENMKSMYMRGFSKQQLRAFKHHLLTVEVE